MNQSGSAVKNIPQPNSATTPSSGFLDAFKPVSVKLPIAAGVIGILFTFYSQIQTIKQGRSSNELILSNLYSFTLPFALSVILIVIGFFVWQSVSGKTGLGYPILFILTGLSFIISNISLLMSLYQVNVG